jgi:16S rRNA (guanine527-N7)-methyltransferase
MKSREHDRAREIEELKKGLHLLSIDYTDQIIEKFRTYLDMLYEYRNRIHLLSETDYSRISRRHFLTSLVALSYLSGHASACDIGAGAGFPSVPLSIMVPDIMFTLFESKQKKANFLKTLIRVLQLPHVRVVSDRAEHYTSKRFDVIVLKAVGKIKRLIKIVDRLIVPGGDAIFYKSSDVEDELKSAKREIEKRNFQVQIEKFTTPLEQQPLTLVILKKPCSKHTRNA